MVRRWIQSADVEVDEVTGALLVDAGLTVDQDGNLKVAMQGQITADVVDLDVEAITGVAPSAATLYDIATAAEGARLYLNALTGDGGYSVSNMIDNLGTIESLLGDQGMLYGAMSDVGNSMQVLTYGASFGLSELATQIQGGSLAQLSDLWNGLMVLNGNETTGLDTVMGGMSLYDLWQNLDAVASAISLMDSDLLRVADNMDILTSSGAYGLGDLEYALTGYCASENTASVIMLLLNQLTGYQVTYHAPLSVAQGAAGSTDLRAAAAGKKVRLHRLFGSLDAAGTLKVQSGGSVDLTGPMAIEANVPFELSWAGQTEACPATASGAKMNLVTTGGKFNGFVVTSQDV